MAQLPKIPVIYSSSDPDEVATIQLSLGRDRSRLVVEDFFAETARELRAAGFSRMIVAGGETSGAVVQGLRGQILQIGPEIDIGVPWTKLSGCQETALALKSGNFGSADFFVRAQALFE